MSYRRLQQGLNPSLTAKMLRRFLIQVANRDFSEELEEYHKKQSEESLVALHRKVEQQVGLRAYSGYDYGAGYYLPAWEVYEMITRLASYLGEEFEDQPVSALGELPDNPLELKVVQYLERRFKPCLDPDYDSDNQLSEMAYEIGAPGDELAILRFGRGVQQENAGATFVKLLQHIRSEDPNNNVQLNRDVDRKFETKPKVKRTYHLDQDSSRLINRITFELSERDGVNYTYSDIVEMGIRLLAEEKGV